MAPGYHADFDGLAPGLYVVEVDMIVLGVHRFSARVSRVAAAETTPPTVTLTTTQQQASGGWFPGAVDVQITADGCGFGPRHAGLGGRLDDPHPLNLDRVTTRIVAEGTHQVRYQATDHQNNTSALATRQINIDLTRPRSPSTDSPTVRSSSRTSVVAIEYACDDAALGHPELRRRLGSGDFLDT